MQVIIDRESGIPYSRQIRDAVIGLVRTGKIGVGEQLLPSRELARILGVSRGTVVKAYEELELSGWVETRVGNGTFVASGAGSEEHEYVPVGRSMGVPWSEIFSRYVSGGQSHVLHELAELVQDAGAINFASALPPEEEFPVEEFRRVVNHVIRANGRSLLQFGTVSGLPALRQYLVRYLGKRGILVQEDEIQIVNGIQQGLDLTARVLIEAGDPVIVESPTYPGAISLFKACQARILPLPVESGEYPVDVLHRLVMRHRPKLFYINPSFHNPTGLTISQETRQKIMEIATEFNLVVVEDDSTGDLPFEGEPPVPLKSLDRYNQVIFLGSFSKHLFPGMRLGWAVAESRLIDRLALVKATTDLHTNGFNQGVMTEFCERGYFESHLRRMRQLYRKNSGIMTGALTDHFPREVVWTNPQGGISLWVTTPAQVDCTELFFKARDRGILFTPGKIFFSGNGGHNNMRLNFSRVRPEEIEKGIQVLGSLLRGMLKGAKQNTPVRDAGTTPLV